MRACFFNDASNKKKKTSVWKHQLFILLPSVNTAALMLNELSFGLPERLDQLFSTRHTCETAGEREGESEGEGEHSLPVSGASSERITVLGLGGGGWGMGSAAEGPTA